MRRHVWIVTLAFVIGVFAWMLSGSIEAGAQHEGKAHQHPEAQKIKNPIAATEDSIATGKKLYGEFCEECHGDAGKGDGMAGQYLPMKPADISDEKWDHGSTDGELFVVIRDGTKNGMLDFREKLKPEQMWHIVNYVRTLGPKPAKNH